ncbi:MAG: hypothetical protein ACU0CA_03315, partial [Paracoccaceae bacterium]
MKTDYINYRKRTRKADGIWEIVWTDPKTGNVRRQSCNTRDEHVAERKLAEKILTGDTVPPKVVTIGYLLERYFQHLKRRKEVGTIVPMNSKIERLNEYFGTQKWIDFSQLEVENYIDHARKITSWGRGKKSLSDGTIKKDLQILRAALRHGHKFKLVPTETSIEIQNLTSIRRTNWLDDTMMLAVFEACAFDPDREHIYAFLVVALPTAARKRAVFELKWDQVYIPTPKTMLIEDEPAPQERKGVISTPKKAFKEVITKDKSLDWVTGEVVQGAYIDFGEAHGNKKRPTIPIA